jgi:hypothetical protein
MAITYEKISSTQIAVYLPAAGNRRRKAGDIRARLTTGPASVRIDGAKIKWQYVPLGKKRGGQLFDTVSACKLSLENDETTTQ